MAIIGDIVAYVPDADAHWNDTDHHGNYVYDLVYQSGARSGQSVPHEERSPRGFTRDAHGNLLNSAGQQVKPGEPHGYWEATIVEIDAQQAALLAVRHPNPMWTLTIPNVPYSRNPKSHTWHEKEAAHGI
jgi:hypothetical protein